MNTGLWNTWYDLVNNLKTSCARKRTFFWLIIALIGFSIKFDFLGVTSLARGVGLSSNYYTCLLNFFYSTAVDLDQLVSLWVQLVFTRFKGVVTINGRALVIADGIKIGKEGKKMPGVKWLHQESESNTKAEYIMGHFIESIAVLTKGVRSYFAVPLTARIHDGVRFDCKDKRTLLDKAVDLLWTLDLPPFYLVADKYYCSGRLMKQLVAGGAHLITMMKKNASVYYPPEEPTGKRRGRKKKYGKKVKLFDLFETDLPFIKTSDPKNKNVIIEYCSMQLLWRPLGELAQFVFVRHPKHGDGVFMSTDLTLKPLDMILAYELRFKIEILFKQAVHQLGAFMYRFWLKAMQARKRGSGNLELHFTSKELKAKVEKKLRAYHLFIQLGLIAQGLMQYLSIYHHKTVWACFGSWLRTISDETLPSEKVVAMALTRTYAQFLIDRSKGAIFKKFLRDRTPKQSIQEENINFEEAA